MKNDLLKGVICPCPGAIPPFSKLFFSKTAWPIKAKFEVEVPWEGGKKGYMNVPGHMTKMAATPIYGKNLQKSYSPEGKSYGLEIMHAASGTQALQIK